MYVTRKEERKKEERKIIPKSCYHAEGVENFQSNYMRINYAKSKLKILHGICTEQISKQAGAELCQAQFKLEIAMLAIANLLAIRHW